MRIARPYAQAIAAVGRPSLVLALSMAIGALPVWNGRIQARLGFGRTDTFYGGGLPPGGDGPPGEYIGRNSRFGSLDGQRGSIGAAFCIADTAKRVRSQPGAGWR